MTSPSGRLSVVIPTFNRRELVLRAAQSVLDQQGAPALEVVVVDDGSDDGTGAALAARYRDDARVRVLEGGRRYASAARNTGFAAAHGDFVCFLDSDDYWLPGTAAAIFAMFDREPDLAFVSVDGSTLPAAGRPALQRVVAGDSPGWSHPRFPRARLQAGEIVLPGGERSTVLSGDFFPAIVNGDLFYLSALVMRRACAARAGPFNERFHYFNDWEFFARLCLTGPGAYVAVDGFRRDTGRSDQISRNRPRTALARRHLYIVRSLQRRTAVAARYGNELADARRDAEYRMAHCLWLAGQTRRARLYLYSCIHRRHKRAHCLVRLVACWLHLRPRRGSPTGW